MLDISPILLTGSGVIFLLLVMRLNTCLFKPMLKHMDDRAESIKKDLQNAQSNDMEVDSMIQEANDILVKAKKEAAGIREKAYNEAKNIADEKLVVAKSELEEKYAKFRKDLQEDMDTLKETLGASMSQLNQSIKAKLRNI